MWRADMQQWASMQKRTCKASVAIPNKLVIGSGTGDLSAHYCIVSGIQVNMICCLILRRMCHDGINNREWISTWFDMRECPGGVNSLPATANNRRAVSRPARIEQMSAECPFVL
jgi:hypothetical protein